MTGGQPGPGEDAAATPRGRLTRGVVVSTFLRSFLIQGSWNYHSMLGSGFAFAMLPGLRAILGADQKEFDAGVDRHLEHFNAHPYLASVALGAALRLEADGADPAMVRRFKMAVRGPLGSLGDALVWATWLPGVALFALTLYWFGVPSWIAAVAFLVVYNIGHVGLRAWGLRLGLRSGREVASRLARADLAGWTVRLEPLAVLLLGAMAGAVLGGDEGLGPAHPVWSGLAGLAFVAGLLGGHRMWRPAAVGTVVAIALIAGWGMLT